LGGELVKLTRADRDLQQNVQNALAGSSREIAANRTALQEVVGKVNEMGERMEQLRSAPVAAARPAAAAGAADSESDASAPAEAGIHVIASGDTLSKIAQQYGVSLTQLQRANPTVNPRALQIGQRIVIPQP
jgi:LysM repeat protein